MNKATPAFTCLACGEAFTRKPGTRGPAPKHCSKACKAASRKAREEANGIRERNKAKQRAKAAASRAKATREGKRPTRPCAYCGVLMDNVRRKQCGSSECRRQWQAERLLAWQRQYKELHGTWYAQPYSKTDQARKMASVRRHRRRALEAEAFVEDFTPESIYERDAWTCHLCKQKIDKTVKAPEPKAPSIDHLVPLSLGGKHERANVAAAHFGCNARKGNRSTPDQLLLFG
ncbi:HNH endonuclease [Nocardiopsis dassonvillei]|uniref:HNH endonuclease n=1 Tax=Nocardiopsis dassonvillei TaxID=2014 RepID=UPI0020A39386|nr:HNH endonuclease [Nocardiopsis dassonvillei]MCP3017292.1 HNH endonuclease [Nocardiopsis dassonvillei]